MTCTHRDSLGRWTTIGYRCAKCGGLCALGEANDGGEHAASVEIEKLAVFLIGERGFVSLAHKDYHDREWIDADYNFAYRDAGAAS